MRELLIVFITAMLPISELRGAIPLGIEVFGLSLPLVLTLAIIGNIIPVFFILALIGPVSDWLRKRSRFFEKFFSWLFARTRTKYIKQHERFGQAALLAFVAIPLPVTGAWTGALAAWLFGIPSRRAIPVIFGGIVIAAFIVTILTVGYGLLI